MSAPSQLQSDLFSDASSPQLSVLLLAAAELWVRPACVQGTHLKAVVESQSGHALSLL